MAPVTTAVPMTKVSLWFMLSLLRDDPVLDGPRAYIKKHHWTYKGAQGPDNWRLEYPRCDGERQSPIDIQKAKCLYDPDLSDFTFINYTEPSTSFGAGSLLNFTNNGHAASVRIRGDLWLEGGGLPNPRYKTVEFHFHWGSSDDTGSEHSVDGRKYPLEMHVVSYADKYKTLSGAFNQSDGLAVLGTFFEISEQDNPAFEPLANALQFIKKAGEFQMLEGVELRSLLPRDTSRYWRYPGSLTTPHCFETVTWTVFEEPQKISARQLAGLRYLLHEPSHLSTNTNGHDNSPTNMVDNWRPVQKLHDRVVRQSFPGPASSKSGQTGPGLVSDDDMATVHSKDLTSSVSASSSFISNTEPTSSILSSTLSSMNILPFSSSPLSSDTPGMASSLTTISSPILSVLSTPLSFIALSNPQISPSDDPPSLISATEMSTMLKDTPSVNASSLELAYNSASSSPLLQKPHAIPQQGFSVSSSPSVVMSQTLNPFSSLLLSKQSPDNSALPYDTPLITSSLVKTVSNDQFRQTSLSPLYDVVASTEFSAFVNFTSDPTREDISRATSVTLKTATETTGKTVKPDSKNASGPLPDSVTDLNLDQPTDTDHANSSFMFSMANTKQSPSANKAGLNHVVQPITSHLSQVTTLANRSSASDGPVTSEQVEFKPVNTSVSVSILAVTDYSEPPAQSSTLKPTVSTSAHSTVASSQLGVGLKSMAVLSTHQTTTNLVTRTFIETTTSGVSKNTGRTTLSGVSKKPDNVVPTSTHQISRDSRRVKELSEMLRQLLIKAVSSFQNRTTGPPTNTTAISPQPKNSSNAMPHHVVQRLRSSLFQPSQQPASMDRHQRGRNVLRPTDHRTISHTNTVIVQHSDNTAGRPFIFLHKFKQPVRIQRPFYDRFANGMQQTSTISIRSTA